MIAYIFIIIFSVIAITVSLFFSGASLVFCLTAPILSVVFLILIDATISTIVRLLPKKWFNCEKKIFMVSKKETAIYEFLAIKRWKDYVFELGHFTGFRKNKIENPKSPEYFERFIYESNYGLVGHIINCGAGFLIIFLFPISTVWNLAFPAACVNFVLNILPAFILRYNLPKLHAIRNFLVKKNKILTN